MIIRKLKNYLYPFALHVFCNFSVAGFRQEIAKVRTIIVLKISEQGLVKQRNFKTLTKCMRSCVKLEAVTGESRHYFGDLL